MRTTDTPLNNLSADHELTYIYRDRRAEINELTERRDITQRDT